MRNAWMLAAIVTVGCAGDETDIGQLPRCTGVVYDSCTNEHECMSGDCRIVTTEQMCVATCSATEPCPPLNGEQVTCNAGGLCEPPAPRECRP